ncbi:hypothetical protein BH10PLA2_BH10PLA2_18030 [soil metagenome]
MSATASTTREQKSGRSSRRWLIWLFFLVTPFAVIVLGYLFTRFTGSMRLDEAMVEADRLDPGWRMADLEASRDPYPKPELNGMDHVLRVKAAMPKGMWPEWPFPQFHDDPPYLSEVRQAMNDSLAGERSSPTLLNAEQERVLRAEILRAQPAIELGRRMPEFPYGRYPIKLSTDWISTLLPHVQETRKVAYLMSLDGRLRAHNQDMDGALHDVKATLYASRAIGDEQFLISQLVRIACDTAAVEQLERMLAYGQASDKALLDLQKELEKQSRTPYFLNGMRGERAGVDYLLDNVQRGEITAAQFRQIQKQTSSMTFNPLRPSRNEWLVELEAWRAYLNIRGERAQLLHLMNKIIELAKQPSWEGAYAIEALITEESKRSPRLSDIIGSIYLLAFADARSVAILRTAYTAVAVERFRLAKGRWPNNLAELVPLYLEAVPLDPFDGQPLRMIRKDQTQIIYSVSQDREDQGGTLLQNLTGKGSDIGFILHDVSQRRLPGKPFVFPPHEKINIGIGSAHDDK